MKNKDGIHVLSRAVIIDQDHILLCKTCDIPVNFYYLPGGHIEHGESVETSLLRELMEEAGAECVIKRFLGCLEHSFVPGHNSICHNHEYNFIFEVESKTLKKDIPLKQIESKIELVWMPFKSLSDIDFRAEPLKKLIPYWMETPDSEVLQSVMIEQGN
jgi:8-oxo-dGTP diphosphatase